jgi:hypothetical protein
MRLVFASMVVVATGVGAVAALACPQKSATASNASSASANAACGMSAAECAAKAASGQCPATGASATTAAYKAAKDAGPCPYHNGVSAMTVSSNGGKCAGHNAASTTAAHGACVDHGVSAMAAGLGSNYGMHDHANGLNAHADCDACEDLAACDAELQAAGASMQTVPIKNGVMFVYTAASPGRVNAIQSVMARRTEHLSRIIASGSTARLCDDCKSMRGAMASGRMVREVVNIEGGTLVLVTSDDPALVKRIRDQADAGKTAVKS